MEAKRRKYEMASMKRTFLTKDMKKKIKRRVNKLKQLERIDDFTEIKNFR
jgi:hypothetical protein